MVDVDKVLSVDKAVINVDALAEMFEWDNIGCGGQDFDKLEECFKLLEMLLCGLDETEFFGLFNNELVEFFKSWYEAGRFIDKQIADKERVFFDVGRFENMLKEPCAQFVVILED